MNFLSELNERQRLAVTTVQGPLLVLAGAGTGKTKVITSRIAYMVHTGVHPESIVAVSFTNKAAHEMEERLCVSLGSRRAKKVNLSTFHSFALKLLRENLEKAGLQKNFSIASEGESLQLLKESLEESGLSDLIGVMQAKSKISFYKDMIFNEESFQKSSNVFESKLISKIFTSYNRKLRLFNLIDFDDIVYLAVLMIKNNPDLLSNFQEKFKYLLVDEYQDTSFSQFKFIEYLGQKSQNVCVVGDDDQSIYSWRGARPSIIQDFLDHFPTAKRVTLDQNYRCSQNILHAANGVIRSNTERLGKELWSSKNNQESVVIHSCENAKEEAEFIYDTIQNRMKKNQNLRYSDVAILYRSSGLYIPIEQTFIEKKIPYVLHSGSEFFDKKEVKDLLAYLKFANNEKDLNSLFRIINVPSRGIGIHTLEKIKEQFQSSPQSLPDILNEFAKENKSIEKFLISWNTWGRPMQEACGSFEIQTRLQECYENLGLKKDILLHSSNMQVAQYRLNTIEHVFKVIEKLSSSHSTLTDVHDALHLDDKSFAPKIDTEGKVQFMTIHASKGLEFPIVFVVGLEENILPHEKSLTVKWGEQEERRLFYVAMTRAKEKLFLTHARTRKRIRGENEEQQPSRFLSEIPKDGVVFSHTDPSLEEEKKILAAKQLFSLLRDPQK